MSKIRINDLARELEVKSKAILDALPEVGVTEKKTHSSSVEEHEAEKVRAYLRGASEAQAPQSTLAPTRVDSDEIKTKIDLSNISRPGDVLNAIRKQQAPASAAAPPVRPVAAASPVSNRAVKVPAPPASRPGSAAEDDRSGSDCQADIFCSRAAGRASRQRLPHRRQRASPSASAFANGDDSRGARRASSFINATVCRAFAAAGSRGEISSSSRAGAPANASRRA